MTHQFYALFYVYYIAFMHNIVLNMLPAQQCDSSCSLQYNESLICHQCGVDSVRSMQSMACMRAYVCLSLCQTPVGESEILAMQADTDGVDRWRWWEPPPAPMHSSFLNDSQRKGGNQKRAQQNGQTTDETPTPQT